MEPEASELPKGIVLGRDGNIHIRLTGSTPLDGVGCYITTLAEVFDLKDLGPLTLFMGLHIQYQDDGSFFVSQLKYANEILLKAGMDQCKPTSTPSKPHAQLLDAEGILLSDLTQYRSMVGALQCLTFIRPDIAHSVNMATDINTRRSITCYVIFLGSNAIPWQSKKQSTVSRSLTEADYKALAHCAADVFWVRSLLKDLNQCLPSPPCLQCDNLSALAICSNPVFHSKIKRLDTDYYFVLENVQNGDLLVQYIPTEEQVADVFTKGLHSPVFNKHCHNLGLGSVKHGAAAFVTLL
ncbi:unnamed protein product [Malus baccata var. baccata]